MAGRPKKSECEKVVTVGLALSGEHAREVRKIAAKEDREPGYVKRSLFLRGLAAYHRDGQLKEPENGAFPAQLKIVGRVSAGKPIETVEIQEEITVLSTDIEGVQNPRCLRVVGDSMRDANVMDGDIILVGDCDSPVNRIVVAYIEEKGTLNATLKRWRQKGDKVTLEPANPDYDSETYPAKKMRWYGFLIKVLRTISLPQANENTAAA
jgi:SOS-response transcriptional repressor LexA